MFAAMSDPQPNLMPTEPTASTDDVSAFPLTDLDRKILSMTDEEYTPHTWENLKEIIRSNDLHLLTRTPSSLRAYIAWTASIKARWGSMTAFVLSERLHWPVSSEGALNPAAPLRPLHDPADWRVLRNDWPYGLAPGIAHFIVWSKVRFPVDEGRGDLTSEGRTAVEGFIETTFSAKAGRKNVLWFRNWAALQSVRAVEHVHILVRGEGFERLGEIEG